MGELFILASVLLLLITSYLCGGELYIPVEPEVALMGA